MKRLRATLLLSLSWKSDIYMERIEKCQFRKHNTKMAQKNEAKRLRVTTFVITKLEKII